MSLMRVCVPYPNWEGQMYTESEFQTIYWAVKGVGGADISWTCSVIYQNASLIRGINVSVFCSN